MKVTEPTQINFDLNSGAIIAVLEKTEEFEFKGNLGMTLVVKEIKYRHNNMPVYNYVPLKAFREQAMFIKENSNKGDRVLITYRLDGKEYNNKYYLDAYVVNFQILNRMPGKGDIDTEITEDDDLPF